MINLDGAPYIEFASAILWTGSEMIVFGGGFSDKGYPFY